MWAVADVSDGREKGCNCNQIIVAEVWWDATFFSFALLQLRNYNCNFLSICGREFYGHSRATQRHEVQCNKTVLWAGRQLGMAKRIKTFPFRCVFCANQRITLIMHHKISMHNEWILQWILRLFRLHFIAENIFANLTARPLRWVRSQWFIDWIPPAHKAKITLIDSRSLGDPSQSIKK